MKPRPTVPAPRPLGSVSAGEVLCLREFGRRLNLADRALADAQREGLRTILFGRNKYVLGCDALDWFKRLRDQQADQAAGPAATEGNGTQEAVK
ncbi:MAG: hypothetical protein ABSG86_02660 [Thermoguttaceae bacterium]|jgi:hypothetical protein